MSPKEGDGEEEGWGEGDGDGYISAIHVDKKI